MKTLNFLLTLFQFVLLNLALGWRVFVQFFGLKPQASSLKPHSAPLIVLYSQVAWHGVWQRPQELAVGLARKGWRVLYVCPMQIHERLSRYRGSRTIEHPPHSPNLTVFSPLIFSGEYRWAPIFHLNKRLIAAELRRMLLCTMPTGEGSFQLFANTPLAAFLLDHFRPERLVYDVMDDFSAFDWAPAGSEGMERRLLERADAVFTGTYTLLEKTRPLRPDAQFVNCGVNFDLFHRPPTTEPEDLRNLPRPLIGYVGTLSERVDPDILRRLAEAFPKASIVLIGPVYRTFGEPPQAPNIHYLGLKPHDELGAYLRQCKIALLPFRLTQAALAINPVKMLEYLAAGCVVVSTAIPDVVRFYSDVAFIAASPEDFIEKTRQALAEENASRIQAGIERAKQSSWEAMVETMAAAFK